MANARFLTIFDFTRYRCSLVVIRCRCGHTRHVYPQMLTDLFGVSMSIKGAERRLRCEACGKKAAKLTPMP